MKLVQTWRWFGPNDPVSLSDVRQAGAKAIVTALHHIPHGEVWSADEIRQRQAELKTQEFDWIVVESLPVHEDIKLGSGKVQDYISHYQESLRNLAACGVKIVTYNFMPVNDWTRTSLDYLMADGSRAMHFNWTDLAVFDVHLLKRPNAEKAYPEEILSKAFERHQKMSVGERDRLAWVVMFGIPGEHKRSFKEMNELIARYTDVNRAQLRENLITFLKAVVPVAESCGVKLALHPDDPPFDIFGLPRIVSTQDDYDRLFQAVPSIANGICLCTGSLGANPGNQLPPMIQHFGKRIHFAHLRNVHKDAEGNFYEDDHLTGDTDMFAVMKELLKIQQTLQDPIPFRPDHGHQMLDDLGKETIPGYSAIGRLRGLAELRGLELGICRSEGWS